MSVRVCYLERSGRGGLLTGLRVVGQATDDRWTRVDSAPSAARAQVGVAAAWLAEKLGQSRAGTHLEMLCLDAEGSVCSWLSSPSREPNAVAAIARLGPAGADVESTASTTNAVTFFAGEGLDSSIQPLCEEDEPQTLDSPVATTTRPRSRGSRGGRPAPDTVPTSERLAVLAAVDVPARVLIDDLDALGVEVKSTTSIWHLMAAVWDPSSRLLSKSQESSDTVAQPTTQVILIDPAGKLLWCWSVGGALRAAGSMRLRMHADGSLNYGKAEGIRLRTEALAWSLQTGLSPRRVICIAPPSADPASASAFSAALAQDDDALAVDFAINEDPIGATLLRAASTLEETPRPVESQRPTLGLRSLTVRPTRANRKLWIWSALVITAASALLGVIAWQWRREAGVLRAQAGSYAVAWRDAVKASFPDLEQPVPSDTKLALERQISEKRAELLPAQSAEPAMPVMEEFETLSLVLGSTADLTITNIDLSYETVAITVQTRSIEEADALYEALQRISGSKIQQWTSQFDQVGTAGGPSADGKATPATRATFRGTWDRDWTKKAREGSGANPPGSGGSGGGA